MMREKNIPRVSLLKGFTFVEILIVMVILSIISGISTVVFISLRKDATKAAEDASVAAVRSGIQTYYLQSQTTMRMPEYPAQLDNAGDGSASYANPFFTNVLSSYIIGDWSKLGFAYKGPTGVVYTYTPSNGKFEIGSAVYDWGMNEGSGTTTGSGDFLGTLNGNVTWQQNGKVGSDLHFGTSPGGLGGYVQVADSPALDLTSQGSVGAWIYADSLTPNAGAGIVHKGDKTDFSDEAYSLQFWTGNTIALLVDTAPGQYKLVQTTFNLQPGQWYYVVGTWDSSGMRIYVNGQLNNSNNTQVVAQNSSGNLNIGAQLSNSYSAQLQNLAFTGNIDEAQINNTAMSAADIAAYYNSTK